MGLIRFIFPEKWIILRLDLPLQNKILRFKMIREVLDISTVSYGSYFLCYGCRIGLVIDLYPVAVFYHDLNK